jgi:hypothetical protein
MKDKRHIKSFNEATEKKQNNELVDCLIKKNQDCENKVTMEHENLNNQESAQLGIGAVSGSYLLGRINDFISNDNLSKHKKIVNVWLLTNKREDFPKLPPSICPCEVDSGST